MLERRRKGEKDGAEKEVLDFIPFVEVKWIKTNKVQPQGAELKGQ